MSIYTPINIFDLPRVIVLDDGNQFFSVFVINLCKEMRVQTNFVSIVYPHANKQVGSTNKVIFKGIKKKLDKANGLWAEQLHKVLLTYVTTHYSIIGETLFTLVYREDTMLPFEINMPTW